MKRLCTSDFFPMPALRLRLSSARCSAQASLIMKNARVGIAVGKCVCMYVFIVNACVFVFGAYFCVALRLTN